MKDERLRKSIKDYADRNDVNPVILDDEAYDGAILGISTDGRLVYDYWKMVEELVKDDGCSEEEAIEWIEYNTMRAIPYMGEDAPIVIVSNRDFLLDLYGEKGQ